MLTHVVLFRPKPGLSAEGAASLVAAIERAARDIPSVRRFEVGRQTASPPPYVTGPPPDLPYVAMVWVDDRAALDAYLAHPAHQALGAAFQAALGAAQIFDFETADVAAGGARQLLATRP
jgi:quinol monooxygenase YgiN